MLGIRLLWRNWRGGEMRILAAALLLAVAVVTVVSVLTLRLEKALELQGQALLGANRALQSSQPIPESWLRLAEARGVETALTAEFASMVFAGDEMQLASVKAVGQGYPLLGEIRISREPFATRAETIERAVGVPPAGEAWVDSRLLPVLNIALDDSLEVGEQRLRVSRVVIEEPDRGGGFASFNARVMMNLADMDATGVVQPGSRVAYRLLLAGPDAALDDLLDELRPQFTRHQKLIDLESQQRGLARQLETGRKFLLLAAMMSVLLSGVAIAMAGRAFARRQIDQVALLKSLGAGRSKVVVLYGQQLLTLALLVSALGLVLGDAMQRLVAVSLSSMFPLQMAAPDWRAYMPGVITGLVCLLCFTIPPMWHLPRVSPVKILRRELHTPAINSYLQCLFGLLALLGLVALFSADWVLVGIAAAALLALLVAGAGIAGVLLRLADPLARLGANWRLALGAMKRSFQQSVIQIVIFGLAIMLLLTLAGLRGSLIGDWQQLPADAPNHFLLNIAGDEIEPVRALLRERDLQLTQFYPMVRARLTHINATAMQKADEQRSNVLRREVNLSWAESPGEDNQLIAGVWWDALTANPDKHWVSVESEVAQELGLRLGDQLTFSIGGLELNAEVTSFRTVEWESMNPNFYFLLSPGALERFSPMALTSLHIPAAEKLVVNDLLQRFPTVVVIEMDRVIEQIQAIVERVSAGVSWMLWVMLIASFLVMWAAVNASMDERRQEVALLRALGSGRRRILGSLWIEFALLGAFAGLIALIGAELMLWAVQTQMLEIEPRAHLWLWLLGLLLSVLVIGAMGVLACRRVVTASPASMLQSYN